MLKILTKEISRTKGLIFYKSVVKLSKKKQHKFSSWVELSKYDFHVFLLDQENM